MADHAEGGRRPKSTGWGIFICGPAYAREAIAVGARQIGLRPFTNVLTVALTQTQAALSRAWAVEAGTEMGAARFERATSRV